MSRYIDADKMKPLENLKTTYWVDDELYEDIQEWIDEQPTADVEEVRHGKWIFFQGYITCSSCKAQPYREHRHIDFDNLYKRCPECGAKMDKEKEE